MVTPLDTQLLSFILPVFSFILIYAIIFAILQKVKIFGDNTGTNSVIAFVIAIIFAMTPGAMQFVSFVAPWFVVMVFVAFSFILVFMFFGVKEEQIADLSKETMVLWSIIIIGLIIVIAALAKIFGPLFGSPDPSVVVGAAETVATGSGWEVRRTLFNPKVLATIFILLVASQAVKFISLTGEKK